MKNHYSGYLLPAILVFALLLAGAVPMGYAADSSSAAGAAPLQAMRTCALLSGKNLLPAALLAAIMVIAFAASIVLIVNPGHNDSRH